MSLHILSPAVDVDEELDDWYNSSDTSEDIPDPNMSNASLYQDIGCLAIPLDAEHFEEGLLYTMTLKAAPQQQMLVWIIEKYESSFSYQVFFKQFSRSKTWHETGKDHTANYDDVWRLAPRRELVRP